MELIILSGSDKESSSKADSSRDRRNGERELETRVELEVVSDRILAGRKIPFVGFIIMSMCCNKFHRYQLQRRAMTRLERRITTFPLLSSVIICVRLSILLLRIRRIGRVCLALLFLQRTQPSATCESFGGMLNRTFFFVGSSGPSRNIEPSNYGV